MTTNPTPKTTTNTSTNTSTKATKIKTIGILGGGQLGMMLAQAALPLGYRCVFLEDSPNCPASLYGKVYSSQQFEDFANHADVFTLEFENVPVKTVQWLQKLSQPNPTTDIDVDANVDTNVDADDTHKYGMYPPADALQVAQDRLAEKRLFNELDIATVPFMAVNNKEELNQAVQTLGLPLIVKTSRGGYDGKGQFIIRHHDDVITAWQKLGSAVTGDGSLTATPAPLIAESLIDFSREVSIIAVRGQDGQMRCYDLVENYHHNGILAKSQAPAVGVGTLQEQAHHAITKLLTHLDYVGVLTLELFVSKNADGVPIVLANEIAPRVHNSGHWSIEGAITSQFENHIRAVVGLPLGDTDNVRPSVMINVLGQYPDIDKVLAIDGCHYHTYHKQERTERKIAHITVMPNDVSDLEPALQALIASLPNKVGLD